MEQKFKIGDVVRLKSGSPKMTIVNDKTMTDIKRGKVYGGKYECAWFDGANEIRGTFPQDGIEIDS